MTMDFSEIKSRVRACGHILSTHRRYWSIHPFEKDIFGWEATNPRLSEFLRSWTLDEVEAFERCPHLHPKAPQELKELAFQCNQLSQLPVFHRDDVVLPASMSLHIKERKWKQIVSFVSSIHQENHAFVDWCCGKGHLGRVLSSIHSVPVYGLEYDMDLVEKGRQFVGQAASRIDALRSKLDAARHNTRLLYRFFAEEEDPKESRVSLILRHIIALVN